jgi:hypothetical protein
MEKTERGVFDNLHGFKLVPCFFLYWMIVEILISFDQYTLLSKVCNLFHVHHSWYWNLQCCCATSYLIIMQLENKELLRVLQEQLSCNKIIRFYGCMN